MNNMSTLNLHGVRMWVTEGCNASCHFCMNSKERSHAQIDIRKFTKLCLYFRQNGFDRIAIMGGEPTIHPDFLDIMETAQEHFSTVYLFTNALSYNELLKYEPRKTDTIVYNFNFSKNLKPETILLGKLGERVLNVVIDKDSNIIELTKEILRVASFDYEKIKVQLVINSCLNIFKYKDLIVSKVNDLYNKLNVEPRVKKVFECNAPMCFTIGTILPPFKQNTICEPKSVLIDGDCNLQFCNLYSAPLINMFNENGIIPFAIVKNQIELAYYKSRISCLEKICKYCVFYNSKCNGKCLIGQNTISKEDIVSITNLPWLKLCDNDY